MLTIIKPGLLTTIQDLGRLGYQQYGVVTSGAMDQLSHRIANLIVGNEEQEATIEFTLLGPTILFEKECMISLCGAAVSATLNGRELSMWKPIQVKKNSRLVIGRVQKGCRGYLAVGGGFDIPLVLNSKSTYLRGKIGGWQGRALQSNDRIRINETRYSTLISTNWSINNSIVPNVQTKKQIRILKGKQFDWFTYESKQSFLSTTYTVTTQSDRMGYRLNGSELSLIDNKEMISEAVSFGTIQVPSEGKPIILLADRQTTGGYPKIAHVVSVDLPHLAQCKPEDQLSFILVSHEEAQRLFIEREKELRLLKKVINIKRSERRYI